MKDFVRSNGYQKTTTSPRSMGSKRYTNLLIKIRSWSESSGAMLVPSTFTGWYKKIMMTSARPTAINRSRVHTRISWRRWRLGSLVEEAGAEECAVLSTATSGGFAGEVSVRSSEFGIFVQLYL